MFRSQNAKSTDARDMYAPGQAIYKAVVVDGSTVTGIFRLGGRKGSVEPFEEIGGLPALEILRNEKYCWWRKVANTSPPCSRELLSTRKCSGLKVTDCHVQFFIKKRDRIYKPSNMFVTEPSTEFIAYKCFA
jgi:hypothetical protein